ncbi:hypothetical protein OHD31_00085 [Escherichia coli]|nr:hypothetical protein [Escherichia coli]
MSAAPDRSHGDDGWGITMGDGRALLMRARIVCKQHIAEREVLPQPRGRTAMDAEAQALTRNGNMFW